MTYHSIMTNTTNITFYERVEDALQDTQARGAFDRATKRFTTLRATAFTSLPADGDSTRDQARAIRAETLSHLDQYLAQFADAVEAAGPPTLLKPIGLLATSRRRTTSSVWSNPNRW
jgi:L-lactate utilization protein LutB